MAVRRAASAASAWSTTSPDRPRFSWAARRESGSSRSTRGSITSRGYRPGATCLLRGRQDQREGGCLGGHRAARLAVGGPVLAVLGQVVGGQLRLVGAEDPGHAVGVREAGTETARAGRELGQGRGVVGQDGAAVASDGGGVSGAVAGRLGGVA